MALLSLSLSGYRGFASAQKLDLAVPNNGPGSGLTVLVGPNNAGKSSIIEALQFLQDPDSPPELREGQRNALTGGDIRFEYVTDAGPLALETGAGGQLAWGPRGPTPKQGFVFTLPSRRTFTPRFTQSSTDRATYARNIPLAAYRQPNPEPFTRRLRNAVSNRTGFNAVMQRILGESPVWYIEQQEGGQHYLKITSAATPHSGDGLGDGVVSLFMIVDALYDARPGDLVVLDEPELSLHPAVQKRLAQFLVEFSANHQIIVATHSPYLVSIAALADGARLARVALINKKSTIFPLTPETARQLAGLNDDIHNPHTLGVRAREAFFLEDGVILVEGQEDVMGYERLFSSFSDRPNAEFFGWGTGGASKMPTIAQMLHELGFQRVMGILDSGQDPVAKALRNRFGQYRFHVIPTEDIRDKPETKARPARSGLLASDLSIKSEHRNAMNTLYREALEYFRPAPAE